MRLVHALAVLAVAACLSAAAAVPTRMSFQGYLTSPDGVPVNATVSMTLKLYDAPENGSLVWSETQPSVAVANGVYNVVLGNSTPLTETVLNGPRYLAVAVGADADMMPRTPLASAPYAILARALSAPIGTALLEDGAVTFPKIASGGCAPGKVIKRTVSGWDCGDDIDTTGSVTASSPLQVTGSNVSLAGTVAVANGGTGLSSIAAGGLLYGQGAGAAGVTGAGSVGQVLTATAGGVPQWSNSSSPNLLISHPGPGTLSIQSAGLGVSIQGATFSPDGSLGLGGSSVLIVGGLQVVGARQPAVADAVSATGIDVNDPGPAQVVTIEEYNALVAQFNALLARLRAHGLIEP